MKEKLLMTLIGMIMRMLTSDLLKSFADMMLDFVENHVAGTKSKVDDALILPICDMIRATFDIPDGDTDIENVVPEKTLD